MFYADQVPDGDCTVTGEWVRYIAVDGLALDAGYSMEDPRYDVLEKRMGIPENNQGHMIRAD